MLFLAGLHCNGRTLCYLETSSTQFDALVASGLIVPYQIRRTQQMNADAIAKAVCAMLQPMLHQIAVPPRDQQAAVVQNLDPSIDVAFGNEDQFAASPLIPFGTVSANTQPTLFEGRATVSAATASASRKRTKDTSATVISTITDHSRLPPKKRMYIFILPRDQCSHPHGTRPML